MKHKSNNGKINSKEPVPIWRVKIGIDTAVAENAIHVFEKAKKIKMKIILN